MNHYIQEVISMTNHKELTILYGVILIPFLTACILIISFSNLVTASAVHEPMSRKYFRAIEVQEGDTLWNIAKQNMTAEYDSIEEYIKEIKTLNGLTTNNIRSGHYISIPYYLSE